MKVVYIHHAGYFGGSSRSLGLFLPHLQKKGIEVYVITPPGTAADFFKKITPNVITISHRSFPLLMTVVGMKNNPFHFLRNYSMVKNIGRIKEIISDISPDLVHCNEWGMVPIAEMVKKMRIPVVMHARTMPEKKYSYFNNYAIDKVAKFCDHLICITGSVHNVFDEIKNKSIIYNPVEVIGADQQRAKNKSLTVLNLSAIHKTKGVFEVLGAAIQLKEYKNIKFYFAGKLHVFDSSKLTFKQKFYEKIGLLDFQESNRFLKIIEDNQLENVELLGHVDDIHALLSGVDVMLAPMHLNAPPRSVYEAGIHGVPSILAMQDKVEDVVEDGVNGFLIPQEDAIALANAILKFAESPELRTKMGAAARARFVKNHNAEKNADQLFKIYQQVVAKKQTAESIAV